MLVDLYMLNRLINKLFLKCLNSITVKKKSKHVTKAIDCRLI